MRGEIHSIFFKFHNEEQQISMKIFQSITQCKYDKILIDIYKAAKVTLQGHNRTHWRNCTKSARKFYKKLSYSW